MTQSISQLIAATNNGRLRIRLLAISHFLDGKNRTQIATFLKVSRTSVNKWVQAYLDDGLDGLKERKHTSRPKALSDEQLDLLKRFILSATVKDDGGRLQGKDVQSFIAQEFGVIYQKSNIYQIMHELELSWITTRSKHPKQSIEAKEAFKKIRI